MKQVTLVSSCRTCTHMYSYHSLGFDCIIDPCKCKEYLPVDNLQFLEYTYDKALRQKSVIRNTVRRLQYQCTRLFK